GQRPRPSGVVPLRPLSRPAVRGRRAANLGRTAPQRRRAGLRVLPARGRADGSGLRAAAAGVTRLVLAALLVDSDDRVEERVLLVFVRDVRGVVPVVVVQSGDGDADVRTDSRAADGEAILRAVSWTARSAREAARMLVALRRVVRKEAVTEEAGRVVGEKRVL